MFTRQTFFSILVLFGIAGMYIHIFDSHSESPSVLRMLSVNSVINKNMDNYENGVEVVHPKKHFEESFQDAPKCRPLGEHEVTFSLAIALPENQISMLSHHCKQWGVAAPISIAVWTDLSPEEVMKKILSFKYNECRAEQMTIATLSTYHEHPTTYIEYPLYKLRNLAIQGIQTTHVISLDIYIWASVDLYETLNTPSIVQELSKNSHLAIVLPAFEVKNKKCSSHKKCIKHIPATFESLVMKLSEKSVDLMDPLDFSRQGSTQYRSWIKQTYGQLVDINCVSSNYYEPFLAVRYCEDLPPFQEVLKAEENGMGKLDKDGAKDDLTSAWILHLLRLGYSLKQVGGIFVINKPSDDDQSPMNKDTTQIGKGANTNVLSSKTGGSHLRKTNRSRSRAEFIRWLHQNIPDYRVVQKCDDFEASEDPLA